MRLIDFLDKGIKEYDAIVDAVNASGDEAASQVLRATGQGYWNVKQFLEVNPDTTQDKVFTIANNALVKNDSSFYKEVLEEIIKLIQPEKELSRLEYIES